MISQKFLLFYVAVSADDKSVYFQAALSFIQEVFYVATETVISVFKNRKTSINNV